MKKKILNVLDQFRNKAGAWQSQAKASKLLFELKTLLKEDEWKELNIAHSHYLIGEGSEELYDVCKRIIQKYK